MAYVWQTTIQKGMLIDQDFYNSIQSTYNQVITYHCAADNTTYKGTNYTSDNTTDNTTYGQSSTTCTAYRITNYSTYDTDSTRYTNDFISNKTSHAL